MQVMNSQLSSVIYQLFHHTSPHTPHIKFSRHYHFYGFAFPWHLTISKSIAMTNKEILQSDLLDILFEHRNKSYGAYSLRRHYHHRLLIALGIALSAVVMFYFISLLNGNNRENGPLTDGPVDVVKITPINVEKPEPIEPPAQRKRVVQVEQVKDLIIKIVPDRLVDETLPDQKLIEQSAISDKTLKGLPAVDPAKGITNITTTGSEAKEKPQEETEFRPYEIAPSFPGGPEALASFFSRTLSAPADLEAGEKKIVLIRFVVGADGSITKAEIVQSGGDSYDREVLRAFKRMPRWNPAMQNGSKIAVSFTQPVTFLGVDQ
jgi:protein TonB